MLKRVFQIFIVFVIFVAPIISEASEISERLKGRILLQVEDNGEAWYVNPESGLRYFLGRPNDAFDLMRNQGVGITNVNLLKIEIGGSLDDSSILDSDDDGYSDIDELRNGFNPYGEGRIIYNLNLAKTNSGKIFLQVEENGEAWYVNPVDLKRYYLGSPAAAYEVMRSLGLGIINDDLFQITTKDLNFSSAQTEKLIHAAVNIERRKHGLGELLWNDELAKVAREHSENLAKENIAIASSKGHKCDLPLIHHEGFNFGTYQSDRLNNRGVYYFNGAAENIALISSVKYSINYYEGDGVLEELEKCNETKIQYDSAFKKVIYSDMKVDTKLNFVLDELKTRTKTYDNSFEFKNIDLELIPEDEVIETTVDGWMNSPGHRENILTKEFDEAGVGAAYTSGGYLISTQVFIARTDCGYKNGPCCEGYGCYVPNTCTKGVCID